MNKIKFGKSWKLGFLIFGSVLVWAGFRTFIDDIKFIVSLDNLINKIIIEFWKVLSVPSVFIFFSVVLLLYFSRDYLSILIPGLKEIEAGGIKAKFDFIFPKFKDVNSNDTAIPEREKTLFLASESLSNEEINFMVNKFGLTNFKILEYLAVEPRHINESLEKISELLSELEIGKDPVRYVKKSRESAWVYLVGFSIGNLTMFRTKSDDKKMLHVFIDDRVVKAFEKLYEKKIEQYYSKDAFYKLI